LRNISGVDDVRAALSNATLRRLLSVGTNWTQLRVAIRFSMEDPGADMTSQPTFSLGVCSGTANPFNNGSATTDHWVGLRSTMATWARSAGPPPYTTLYPYTMRPYKRVGTTYSYAPGTNNLLYAWYVLYGTSIRQVFAVDITKGSPNFTITYVARTGISNPDDVSKETFLQQISLLTPNIPGHSRSGTGNPIAVDEATDGYLNAVNVAWDRSSPKLEISDLAVVRFA
jgi:hypothetical protein